MGDWASLRVALQYVREAVFIVEQGIPPELEWDEHDVASRHALARTPIDGRPVGCGRLLPDGHIGRMAVLVECRGQGVGRQILNTLVNVAREDGMTMLQLHAQVHAVGFYEQAGFAADGPPFDEAGIPHQRMVRALVN